MTAVQMVRAFGLAVVVQHRLELADSLTFHEDPGVGLWRQIDCLGHYAEFDNMPVVVGMVSLLVYVATCGGRYHRTEF